MGSVKLLSGQALADAIWGVLRSDGTLRCAVAFWGPEIAALVSERSARVVLDVKMKGTSQNALKALGVPQNQNIRVLDYLHANLYIGEDYAIFASAHASINAIGMLGSSPLLHEAGVWINRINDPDLYQEAHELFEHYWNSSKVVDQTVLDGAVIASMITSARDQRPNSDDSDSILMAVLTEIEIFQQTAFIFTDEPISENEEAEANLAYANSLNESPSAALPGELICILNDEDESRALEGTANIIMYWFGEEPGILPYYGVAPITLLNGSTAFFGHKDWPTVRDRIGLGRLQGLANSWKADRTRAQVLANLNGKIPGKRFVVFRYDELYAALEGNG